MITDDNNVHRPLTITTVELSRDEKLLQNYEPDEIFYTAKQLWEAGFIKASKTAGGGGIRRLDIEDIIWSGHELLGNIKNNTVWKHTVSCAKKIGITSVKGLFHMSGQVIAAIVSNPQALQQIIQQLS